MRDVRLVKRHRYIECRVSMDAFLRKRFRIMARFIELDISKVLAEAKREDYDLQDNYLFGTDPRRSRIFGSGSSRVPRKHTVA